MSLAQVTALAVGMVLIVLGALVVARTGLHVHHLGDRTEVAGLGASTLWGLVEIGVGAVLLVSGSLPPLVRGPAIFLGVGLLAFGVIVVVQPMSFRGPLDLSRRGGALDMVLGLVLLAGTIVPSVVSLGRHWLMDRRAVST